MKARALSLILSSSVLVLTGCLTAASMASGGLIVLKGDASLEQLPVTAGEHSLAVDIVRGEAAVPGLTKALVVFIPGRDGTVRLKVRIPSENITTRAVKIDSIQAEVDPSANPMKLEFRDTVLVAFDEGVIVKILRGSRFSFKFAVGPARG